MSESTKILVWDRPTRVFHWVLVISFFSAYFSGEFNQEELHEIFAYIVLALMMFRLFWGVVGGHYSRFSHFNFSIKTVFNYLVDVKNGRGQRYLGHNPAGSFMVFALLTALFLLLVSGFLTQAVIEFEGPIWQLMMEVGDVSSLLFRQVHRYLPNIVIGLVCFHVAGVVLSSVSHKENLVKSMWSGYKNEKSGSKNEKSGSK